MLPAAGGIESIAWGLIMGGGGARIRSLQTGSTSPSTDNQTEVTVTIAPVDLSQSFVIATTTVTRNDSTSGTGNYSARVDLVNSTTLRISNPARLSPDIAVEWTVVELEGASVQQITTFLNASGTNLTDRIVSIAPVDPSRTFVVMTTSFDTPWAMTLTDALFNTCYGQIISPTELRVMRRGRFLDSGDVLAVSVTAFVVEVK